VHADWLFDDRDRQWMRRALEVARRAGERGEVPVGAVLVCDGHEIAAQGNDREGSLDPTGHAEIRALRAAATALGDWRLETATLYVTLEPCAMCVAACRQARVQLVVWGASDEAAGACGGVMDLANDPRIGPPLAHRGGLLADEARTLLRDFFAKRRRSS
jgi:tRNA(adenine34) deaminase